ncbi:MAG: hypothetical protein A49_08800 [Methyloceanibacter sp.]|nr:MAG: hypothetical protein A49_08800 [Methyloceanibacter sp.]
MTETLESLNPFKAQLREAETGHERRATRHDWQTFEIVDLLEAPLFDLIDEARAVHRRYHADGQVQLASLLSIKTGACPEDCKYCPQSAHYAKKTGLERESLLDVEDVLSKARIAKDAGATRFCMGAAWRQVKDGPEFEKVLHMVRGVRDLEMEACVTLGMVTKDQAGRLAEAGLTAYNHNLDTSPEFYNEIITTRTYEDRLETIANVRSAGVKSAAAALSAWARASRTGHGFFRNWRRSIRIRRAFRSMRWCRSPGPRSNPKPRSNRSNSCAWWRPPAF